jgi:ubiquinone/menaquinone biosynthesis C-methylase UbiE
MATHQYRSGHCLGLDLSDSMVQRARARTAALSNVTVETGDFLTWDFGNQRFDAVFSMEVFYYFDDIGAGLHRAWSILNPGGTLWVAVNFYEENRQSADWPDRLGTPMKRWSKRDYFDGFTRAGFEAVKQRLIVAPVPEGSEHGDTPTLLTVGTKSE